MIAQIFIKNPFSISANAKNEMPMIQIYKISNLSKVHALPETAGFVVAKMQIVVSFNFKPFRLRDFVLIREAARVPG